MDDEVVETNVPTAGERLRAAREEKGLSLEEVASQTRIPRRHLESIEESAWDRLPAPTYTIGFAKSYATAIGLERAEIGDQIRSDMGGERATPAMPEIFEPADPARTMPKWLVLGAIAAVIVIALLLSWLNNRSLQGPDEVEPETAPVEQSTPAQAAPPPAAAQGPVVLTATEAVWLRIRDGATTLKEGIMQPGERFEVSATATAPVLTTGKPEALRINVGAAVAPPVGPPATTVSDVSLLPASLMQSGQAPAAVPPPTTLQPPARQPQARRAAPAPAPPQPAPVTPIDNTTANSAQ